MDTRDFAVPLDAASEAVLKVQREALLRFGAELLAAQRHVLAGLQTEMDQATRDAYERMNSWRGHVLAVIRLSTALLLPWLALLAILVVTTLLLGARARDAWGDYRAATAAADSVGGGGPVTVVKDGTVYVRVDPDSMIRGRRGSWYARAVSVEFPGEPPTAP